MKAQLTQNEIDIILDWCDYSISSKRNFGGAEVIFPSEHLLFKKLSCKPNELELNKSEVDLIFDMMQKAISRKYGNEKYLFGFEQQLYYKISKLINEIHKED